MRTFLKSIGRSKQAGVGIIVASLAVLAVSAFIVVNSLQGDAVELPAEGSLEEILEERTIGDSVVIPGQPAFGQGGGQTDGPKPARLAIPNLYLDAPVVILGVDAENIPQVPDAAGDIAWYDFSAIPGRQNNAVFSGHVDWQTRGGNPIPGVFYRLRELRIGDDIQITLEDGRQLTYRVTGNIATDYDDPNVVKTMSQTVDDVITLITCGGSWIEDSSRGSFGGVYSHRIVVRAERVTPAAADLSATN
ncbi:MAG TPA: class F sortase [Dehalococcoidia bacterium]|nr:class F sortase [Dehalococcoidia bacterium]